MSNRSRRSVVLGVLIVLIGTWAAAGAAATRARRVIDERDRVALKNSVYPMARSQYEVGRAKADLPMERMILTLSLRPGAQADLERLLADQHNPQSPLYHQWLTPEQFGARFGLGAEDMKTVETWLTDQGFTIDEVAKGYGWINFSGTAIQVERAFSTEIHDYRVDGKLHHANATDISLPRGLSDLAQGVVTLHDFPRNLNHSSIRKISPAEIEGKTTFVDGSHNVSPADFAMIYNLNPVYSAGINGTGQTIAIAGRTNINLTDVKFFRSYFGLPANDPIFVHNGLDPGNLGGSEEAEADLAVQWSGAVAPNATVKLVISRSTTTTDGADLAAQYIVSNNLGVAMSTSVATCEVAMGSVELAFYSQLWAQAATQGITPFVSAGNSGASGCSRGGEKIASPPPAVNGLCSTPFNVCVGGTQFNDTSRPSQYWSATNVAATQASALSYIPETAWNESGLVSGGTNLWATGGGASGIYNKPSWQVAAGVPADGKRDVPDVSLTAASHDGYLIFQGHTTGTNGLFAISGTSAASSSFTGLMALIVQKTGVRQGNANTVLYPLGANQFAHTGPTIFNDIVSGNNSVPGLTGFPCTTGYDLATGLGSINGMALVNNWQVPTQLPSSVNTSAQPSAVSLNGTTFVFYKGSIDAQGIFVTRTTGSVTPGNWTAARLPFAVNTSAAPSAVVVGTTLYVAYKGSEGDSGIYVARSLDSAATWSMTRFPGTVNTSAGPGAYVSGGTLYVFFKGPGTDTRMYVAPLPDNTIWNFIGTGPAL